MAFSLPVALSALVCTLCLTRTAFAAEKAEDVKLTYHQLGADWPGMCQTGKTQSPINVVTDDMKPIKGSAGMIDIESVGVVSGASMFLTETLPHFEVVWEEFIEEPVIRVPARKKDGDILAPLSEDLEEDELTMVKIAPLQFHFHNPSENTLNGELLAGGLHIVSAVLKGESEACDAKIKAGSNCFVVLSVFLSEESFYSPFNTLFTKVTRKERANMRRGGNKAVPFSSVLPKLGKEGSQSIGLFDLNTLLPTKSDYATWSGSLTTYPCSEEIMWVQFLQPIPITFKQVSAMRATIARTMGEDCDSQKNGRCSPLRPSFNRREIQPLNGRTIKTGMAF